MFGLVIWGNLIDNAVNPKGILIICEAYFAVSLIVIAGYYQFSNHENPDNVVTFQKMIDATFKNEALARTFYSGIELITIVQLFNWFPRRFNGTTLFLIKIIQPITFGMQFVIGGYTKCFPNMPYYLKGSQPSLCGSAFNSPSPGGRLDFW